MNLPIHAARSRSSDIAIQSVYEVTKLLAASPRPLERLGEVLSLLSHFLELRNAGVALQAMTSQPEVVGLHAMQTDAALRWSALLDLALQRTRSTQMPWVVESERGEYG
ncbi:MAG TPA: hypothetical protein VFQ61_04845, partial [Polyangiaceae bacterium]|nr:hypothetical protein [Polyangiaceae bacterium]